MLTAKVFQYVRDWSRRADNLDWVLAGKFNLGRDFRGVGRLGGHVAAATGQRDKAYMDSNGVDPKFSA
jgi:hypothetical protein